MSRAPKPESGEGEFWYFASLVGIALIPIVYLAWSYLHVSSR